jgi:hypothetical protein
LFEDSDCTIMQNIYNSSFTETFEIPAEWKSLSVTV